MNLKKNQKFEEEKPKDEVDKNKEEKIEKEKPIADVPEET